MRIPISTNQAHLAPDFIAVVDFDPQSPTYVACCGLSRCPAQLMRINETGTRLFVTLNCGGLAGKVVMFNIARPNRPKVMDVVDLGRGSAPHFLRHTRTRNVSL